MKKKIDGQGARIRSLRVKKNEEHERQDLKQVPDDNFLPETDRN